MSLINKILRVASIRSLSLKATTATGFRFSTLQTFGLRRSFQTSSSLLSREEVKVTFVRNSGEKMEAKGKVGDNLVSYFCML